MVFKITHTTSYQYSHPAAEAYGEIRLTPVDRPGQKVISHRVEMDPHTSTSGYLDHFGNIVDFFSLPYRHRSLTIKNHALVETSPVLLPEKSMDLTVQETRQIFTSAMTDVFDYLQPTEVVEIGGESLQWAKKYIPGNGLLRDVLPRLNEAIHAGFEYTKGATDNSTPLSLIWKSKKGVCQDFAHVALSILRTAGLPARYVCGYIETDPPQAPKDPHARRLIGSVATHAWVEVMVPGMIWVPLDPTNCQWCNERYVAVSYGRDFRDATPLRGTFKGSGGQKMEVQVLMKRMNGHV